MHHITDLELRMSHVSLGGFWVIFVITESKTAACL